MLLTKMFQSQGTRPRPIAEALCLAMTVVLAACSGGADEVSRPSLVLITLDTTRADHLGCYGYQEYATSPRIDALATEGVVFE
jgi:hypothetical protein